MAPTGLRQLIRLDVSVGSNSEVRTLNREVGFALNNGRCQSSLSGPESAIIRHPQLLDHLIGAREERRRDIDAKRLSGLQVDD
jgi:hypothetical protein